MAEQAKSWLSSSGRRPWSIAVVLVAIVLAFWSWHRHAGNGSSLVTDPAEIERQARESPDDFRAQLRWGETLMHEKRLDEAGDVLAHARQLAPNDARPYAWLGVIALSQRRVDEARTLLQEALRHDPTNITALREQANLDARERRLRPAIQGFERLVQLRPNDADAWQRLGLLLMGARENYRSFDALSRSAALDPTDMMTQLALGNMALQAGRLDQANNAFRTVLAHEPNDPQALAGMAKTMMRLDPSPIGLDAAENQAGLAIIAAGTPEAYSARGQIRMTRRRWSEAIKDFKTAIELAPRNREYYVYLSQCYAGAGQPDLARKASADFDRLTAEQLARDRMPRQAKPADQKATR